MSNPWADQCGAAIAAVASYQEDRVNFMQVVSRWLRTGVFDEATASDQGCAFKENEMRQRAMVDSAFTALRLHRWTGLF
jgi:hypothetical protein